ncbi:hypothetical protein MPLSOD_150067 [Mesorhizobium sp. SOD10]|nr:hypothetical protein MPLSOD_150067 [Mesorhizobium sp. SOD10]
MLAFSLFGPLWAGQRSGLFLSLRLRQWRVVQLLRALRESSSKRNVGPPNFVDGDEDIVRGDLACCNQPFVDISQQGLLCFVGAPLDKGDLKDKQLRGIRKPQITLGMDVVVAIILAEQLIAIFVRNTQIRNNGRLDGISHLPL